MVKNHYKFKEHTLKVKFSVIKTPLKFLLKFNNATLLSVLLKNRTRFADTKMVNLNFLKLFLYRDEIILISARLCVYVHIFMFHGNGMTYDK